MSETKLGIRKFHDASGYVRVALRYGLPGSGWDRPPYAHFTSATGMRVDRQGRPVRQGERANFSPIEWDLAVPARPRSEAGVPTVAAVWHVLTRSAAFVRAFEAIRRVGATLRAPRADGVSCVHVGTPMIEVAAAPRGGFVARLVEQIAIAFVFADGAYLPVTDAQATDFARVNANFLIDRYGRAKLLAALVRDEILSAGGPDIGGPGLRGDQLEHFDRHRMGESTFDVAAAAIGRSAEGDTGAPFHEVYGPPAGRLLHDAFTARKPVTRSRVDPAVASLVALVARLDTVDHATVDSASRSLGLGFDVVDISNAYWTVSRSAATPGAAALELHVPNDGSPRGRFVVYPDGPLGIDQVAAAYPGGIPLHVGARASDRHASMAFSLGRRSLVVGFDVRSGVVDPVVVGPYLRPA